MELHICNDADDLSREAAEWITARIHHTLQKQDRFTIALSGGSTPVKLFGLLRHAPYRERINWSRMHIFFGDERGVPFSDSRNNAHMAYDTLLDHVPIPGEQIHPMRTDIPPEESAASYERVLHHYFHGHAHSFDLVLLGMGDDGHTLSLFPGTSVVHEEKKWTAAYYLEPQEMYRITLTAPLVNRAACVAFLVSGAGKAKALKEVLEGDFHPEQFPSQVIKPPEGELHWFLDRPAASLLE
jgi:6-phosphogluconolactonase